MLAGGGDGRDADAGPATLPVDEMDERWADGVVGQERFCLELSGGRMGREGMADRAIWAGGCGVGRAGIRTVVNATLHGSREADHVVETSNGFARLVPCSVGQLIALTRRAGVVIAGDTGPLHLAAALERPVVGIYGPTDPARNGPYGTRQRVLRDERSTTSHKRSKEPEPGMLKIGVDEVVAGALEMLG